MPYLKQLIEKHISPSTQNKGKNIFRSNMVIGFYNEFGMDNGLEFSVLSESNVENSYFVNFTLNGFEKPGPKCDCPQHQRETYCKHVAAAMFYLLDKFPKFETTEAIKKLKQLNVEDSNLTTIEKINPLTTLLNKKPIETLEYQSGKLYNDYIDCLKDLTYNEEKIIKYTYRHFDIKIIEQDLLKSTVTFKVDSEKVYFEIFNDHFISKCTCKHKKRTACVHAKVILYAGLNETDNPYYILTFRNHIDEFNKLIKKAGYDPIEPEVKNLFDFSFEKNKPILLPAKGFIFDFTNSSSIKNIENLRPKKLDQIPVIKAIPDDYIVIFKDQVNNPNGFSIDLHPITGTSDLPITIKGKVPLKVLTDTKLYDENLGLFCFKWSPAGMVATIRENNPSSGYNISIEEELTYRMNDEKRKYLFEKLIQFSQEHLTKFIDSNKFYYLNESNFKPKKDNLTAISINKELAMVTLKLTKNKYYLSAKPFLDLNGTLIDPANCITFKNILFIFNQQLFVIKSLESKNLLESFGNDFELKVLNQNVPEFLSKYILPLQKKHKIEIPDELIPKITNPQKIEKAVALREIEPNYLIIEPIVIYDDVQFKIFDDNNIIYKNEVSQILQRDNEFENEFENEIRGLHPDFEHQNEQDFFYLPIKKVIQNHWFFDLFKTLEENKITVFGQKDLKKLRFNTNRPKVNINGSSGIDWFDLQIELSYGEEIVPLKTLKTALINKQDYIALSDGSLGILPEEWIKKLAPMLKIGETIDKKLRMSKLHFGLIDANEEFLNDEKIRVEIEQKKKNLLNIEQVSDFELPKNIKATLRPYQLSGFHWFNKLYQLGWGGCLADDMGLGKTLQSLSFLRHIHNQKPNATSIIICPTSLIYNWLKECQKFTPSLKAAAFHGSGREMPNFDKIDLLITSYGTFRNDLEKLKNIDFEICILDESQAIKNPIAHITKAVSEVKTKYKYILSGTPLQNNTFDLYSQFNFINPGLLGNQEYFKEEFSNPIDKQADTQKSQLLRKIIYPFMMRRTKEQVAKDLPTKTESIVYCEMESYQKRVYEGIKIEYRDKILGKIESDGVSKTAFLILEGLNKLRMACDCPSLVKDGDSHPYKSESIKLKEIIREIDENSGNHKILIFSQFLGMLQLIKEQLHKKNIKHLYLDGATPAKDRQGLVDEFQNDPDTKAFLISLKAGGVGLNLTAADYVYIVDPWWNPAVEAQAIDRTHRIGQKNKIFAYKLICKDSIEEKIQELQNRKKALAKEIIAEEASFIKKLTKDDVAWLLE